jgi:hypothetical protein
MTATLQSTDTATRFTAFIIQKLSWLKLTPDKAVFLNESEMLVCGKLHGYRYCLFQKTADGFVQIKDYGTNEVKMLADFKMLRSMPHIPLYSPSVGMDGWKVARGHCIAGVVHYVDSKGDRRTSKHNSTWKLDHKIKDFAIGYIDHGIETVVKAIA